MCVEEKAGEGTNGLETEESEGPAANSHRATLRHGLEILTT